MRLLPNKSQAGRRNVDGSRDQNMVLSNWVVLYAFRDRRFKRVEGVVMVEIASRIRKRSSNANKCANSQVEDPLHPLTPDRMIFSRRCAKRLVLNLHTVTEEVHAFTKITEKNVLLSRRDTATK